MAHDAELPSSFWRETSLGELATFVNGMAFKPSDWGDTGRPIIRIQNLTGTSTEFHRYAGAVPEKYIVRDGDILMSWSATLGVFQWRGEEALLNQHIFRVLPKCDPMFCRHLLGSLLGQLRTTTHGSSMTHLTKGRFEATRVLVPPLEEQRRIADLLDEADRLQRLRKEANEKAHRILPALFEDMFGDPETNPMGWEERPLGDVLVQVDTGWSPRCHDRPAHDDEWGVLRLGAVSFGVFSDLMNKTLPDDAEPHPHAEVRVGDVLFSRKNTRQLVGATVYVDRVRPRLMFSDLMFRLRGSELVAQEYLAAVLSTDAAREKVRVQASGSTASMVNVSKARLKTVSILVPPLELQKQFASICQQVRLLHLEQSTAKEWLAAATKTIRSRLFAEAMQKEPALASGRGNR